MTNILFGLNTPYGDMNLGQHWSRYWLAAWRHQVITWTNVDIPLRFSGVHIIISHVLINLIRNSWYYYIRLDSGNVFRQYTLKLLHLPGANVLTHLERVTNTCVGNPTIIGSDNGLSPGRRQAIIWTNAGILLTGPSVTNFGEILIENLSFPFTKMRVKLSPANGGHFVSASMC